MFRSAAASRISDRRAVIETVHGDGFWAKVSATRQSHGSECGKDEFFVLSNFIINKSIGCAFETVRHARLAVTVEPGVAPAEAELSIPGGVAHQLMPRYVLSNLPPCTAPSSRSSCEKRATSSGAPQGPWHDAPR